MRKWGITLILLGLVFLMTFGLTKATIAGGRSYVMMCRGGGDMELRLDISQGRSCIRIDAKAARVGANQRLPQPGECVWLDRGMRPEEYWGDRNLVLGIYPLFEGYPFIKVVKLSKGNISIYWSSQKAEYLFNAVKDGKTFQVHAIRTGKGKFQVTHIGP